MQGPLRRGFSRISTRGLGENLEWKCRGPRAWKPCRRFCVSLRNRNAHGHATRAILCENLQEKCRAPKSRRTNWSLRSQNRHGHFMREFTRKISRPNITRQTLCEPAQSKCTWTSSKSHFMLRGKTGSKSVPGSTAGLNTFRENPSVRTHCLGKKELPRPILLVGHEASLLWVKQIQQQSARQQYDPLQ